MEHQVNARTERVLYPMFKSYFIRSSGGLSGGDGGMSAKDEHAGTVSLFEGRNMCLLGGYRYAKLLRFMRRTINMEHEMEVRN